MKYIVMSTLKIVHGGALLKQLSPAIGEVVPLVT
jgi:hypothetical protein